MSRAVGPAEGPRRHKLAVATWLALYPTITLLLAVLEGVGLARGPLPLRTLALTLVLVPLMVYVLMPIVSRVLATWLRE